MFVIPCKYNAKSPFVIQLVSDIREYHPDEKIVVVDSNSNDKSYFEKISQYNVIIEDVSNENWMIGAYWHAFNKFSNEEFYFFMHDSMRVKSNLDFLKEKDLTIMMHFKRAGGYFDEWNEIIGDKLKYNYKKIGGGCCGPIFFCKNKVMAKMKENGVDKFLPKNKAETWMYERWYGCFLEDQGYDLEQCSLFGDLFVNESPSGKSGLPPHKTDWQFPIEKFYGSHSDKNRL